MHNGAFAISTLFVFSQLWYKANFDWRCKSSHVISRRVTQIHMYLKRRVFVPPMRRLFVGAYLKGSYHKDKTVTTSWIFFMAYKLEANLSFGFHNSVVFSAGFQQRPRFRWKSIQMC